jgi:Raf kinase inhibitor-like YbhB/YbcL family protein
MKLTSSVFDDGGSIPEKYGYEEENVSPPLRVEDAPDNAESFALVMDDPDAKPIAGKIWTHWVVWNLPAETTDIPEGDLPDDAVEGKTDYGEEAYGGPNPPGEEHTYRFKLYALDASLDLEAGSTEDDLEDAMDGHIVDETQLTGTYS